MSMDDRHPAPIPKSNVVHGRHPIPAVWIVPFLAALIAIYLIWHSYWNTGPVITITFNNAEGLVVGQTQVKYKAVALGTVSEMKLDGKSEKVVVKVKMTVSAEEILTDSARFWIVRPHLAPGNISGIETLVSGSYIQCDPGAKKGNAQTEFVGLEDPPAIRSDERGQTFQLKTDKLGSIAKGSPVYFRDIDVGDVLNYDIGDGFGPVLLTIFVREPYNHFIKKDTRFWNSSSLVVNVGPTGLQIQLQSLQALLTGGIAFYTPKRDSAPVAKDEVFPLYSNKLTADMGDIQKSVSFASYFESSMKNIGPGAPVYIFGIQVGEVTGVHLVIDPGTADVSVRVAYEIQPERIFSRGDPDSPDPDKVIARLVNKGMRAKVDSGGLIPGQSGISLVFSDEKPEDIEREDDVYILPSVPGGGGLDGITDSLSHVAAKIDQLPIQEIGDNFNHLLASTNTTFDQNSDFQRDFRRTMDQVGDAARSFRLLADFLTRHPEALIRGRSGAKEENQ